MHEIDDRVKEIIKIASEVCQINTTIKNRATANDMDIKFDSTALQQQIRSFGDILGDIIVPRPILMTLKDNHNGHVSVQWKLSEKVNFKHVNDCKLKVEWATTDQAKDFDDDEKWQYSTEFHLNAHKLNQLKYNHVATPNQTAKYVFRIQYFDGYNWSQSSNLQTILITKHVSEFCEKWDEWSMGRGLQIDGNSVECTSEADGYKSILLSTVVSKGVHSWTFVIDKSSEWSYFNLIGVWKAGCTPITEECYEQGGHRSYSMLLNGPCLADPSKSLKHLRSKQYGVKNVKNGQTVEMILDLLNYTLSFKTNDIDHGKAFSVEKTSYRAAASLHVGSKYTLSSYQYRDYY